MGKDLRPAARDAGEHLRVALEAVMGDRQADESTAMRLDLEADTRVFRLVVEVIRPRPGENQAARRGMLDDLADHIHRARVDAPMFPAGTGLPVRDVLVRRAVPLRADPILAHHLGSDNRLPAFLRPPPDAVPIHKTLL